jgi:nucleotide-binding universal stress UspA family protein
MTARFAIRRILVALDGSEGSAEALRWAIGLARAVDAEIVAVHAFDLRPAAAPAAAMSIPPTYGDAWRDSEREAFMRLWSRPLAESGVRHRLLFEDGPVGRTLLQVADDQMVDLLVTGRRGRGAIAELLAGSVSQYLIHHARRLPVVVVPSPG